MPIVHKNFVSYPKLLHFYQTHDILVHVPLVIEGYGMVVPEAMAYMVAPVVTKICVLPELVQDGVSGLVVRPGSVTELAKALERLINDPQLLKRLGRGARSRFVDKFSLPVFQQKLVGIFDEVLQQ